MIVRMFQGLAAVFAAAGICYTYRGEMDIAFVTGVLAVCAVFLSIRFTFKPRVDKREAERAAEIDADDS